MRSANADEILNQVSDYRAVREADTFLNEWHEGIQVSKPAPNSRGQRKVATSLAKLINNYESAKDAHDTDAAKVRQKNKIDIKRAYEDDGRDFHPSEVPIGLSIEMIKLLNGLGSYDAWKNRVDAARQLRIAINHARALGILHTGDEHDLLIKLRKCEEERQRLSKQLLEYKSKHILPVRKNKTGDSSQ